MAHYTVLCACLPFLILKIHKMEINEIQIIEPLFWDKNFKMPESPKLIEMNVIKPQFACELNSIWHSRLPKIHWSNVTRNRYYVCYGFSYMGVLIACAIWSSPVNQSFDIEKTLELRRMAISDLCPKNTATNLISRMIKDIEKRFVLVDKLISYQDTEVHHGTIYKASNWFIDAETKFNTWGKSRKRQADQSTSDKIRWGYNIKRKKVITNIKCSHEFVSREYIGQPYGTCESCGCTVFS